MADELTRIPLQATVTATGAEIDFPLVAVSVEELDALEARSRSLVEALEAEEHAVVMAGTDWHKHHCGRPTIEWERCTSPRCVSDRRHRDRITAALAADPAPRKETEGLTRPDDWWPGP